MNAPAQLETGHTGKHHVQNQQIKGALVQEGERTFSVRFNVAGVPGFGQFPSQKRGHLFIVIYNQNIRHCPVHPCVKPRCDTRSPVVRSERYPDATPILRADRF